MNLNLKTGKMRSKRRSRRDDERADSEISSHPHLSQVKLQYIEHECQDPQKRAEKAEAESLLDDFTKLKRNVARNLREIRKQIAQRNELLGKEEERTLGTIRMSHQIRDAIKLVMKEVEQLEALSKGEV